jgi:glucose-6-phosphate 1-dehydrogenase
MLTKVIIFGASGDLGKRKLIPAMENLIDKKLITDVEVIGIGRRKINVEEYLQDIFKDS